MLTAFSTGKMDPFRRFATSKSKKMKKPRITNETYKILGKKQKKLKVQKRQVGSFIYNTHTQGDSKVVLDSYFYD